MIKKNRCCSNSKYRPASLQTPSNSHFTILTDCWPYSWKAVSLEAQMMAPARQHILLLKFVQSSLTTISHSKKRDLLNVSLFFWVADIQQINCVQFLLARGVIWNCFACYFFEISVLCLFFLALYNAQKMLDWARACSSNRLTFSR